MEHGSPVWQALRSAGLFPPGATWILNPVFGGRLGGLRPELCFRPTKIWGTSRKNTAEDEMVGNSQNVRPETTKRKRKSLWAVPGMGAGTVAIWFHKDTRTLGVGSSWQRLTDKSVL